ncbi:hypothetical protein ACHAWF_009617 [Thalassiosira exigua]
MTAGTIRRPGRRRSRPPLVPLLFASLLLPLASASDLASAASSSSHDAAAPRSLTANEAEMYCGRDWSDAAESCGHPCAGGEDAECTDAWGLDGDEYECYYYTGCSATLALEEGGGGGGASDLTGGGALDLAGGSSSSTAAGSNNFCGPTWIHSMLECSENCPGGWECGVPGERCYAATGCDKPLEQLISDLLTTLSGPDETMDDEDGALFTETIMETIGKVAEDLGVAVDVEMEGQELIGRRELTRRMDERRLLGHDHFGTDRFLHWNITSISQRRLPSGSSAIDVSMVVTGDYRPPPYVDLDVVAEDSINRNGDKVVSTLRERGERAGREFFSRVEGIEAVVASKKTKRPSRSPIRSPTWSPIGPPTNFPSGMPTYGPSAEPSSPPSRALVQKIMTGSRQDLQLGGKTTSSFGYVFNMRTKPDAGVIIVTGFDFYTESTDMVNFELWTRPESYLGHKGTYEGWDLVASGTVQGRGIGRYTEIPEDLYVPVSIPGGGGIRAFYLTLDTINLVYKLGDDDGAVKLPDTRPHAETPDLEIWEGEGVLFYPFPDPKDKFFYRAPRRYLGAIYYDRLPCRPYSLFGPVDDLPCPEVPTGSPTVPPPTASPAHPPTRSPSDSPQESPTKLPSWTPTRRPVEGQTPAPHDPTASPSGGPTASREPTPSPTTSEPTFAPIVPIRSHVVASLRNVPERSMTNREAEKFLEIVAAFLRGRTANSVVWAGVELWHQEIVEVDAVEGTPLVPAEGYEIEEQQVSRGISRGVTVAKDSGRDLKRGGGGKKDDGKPTRRPKMVLPKVPASELTLVLKVQASNLPDELLGVAACEAIAEGSDELLGLLKEQQAFYTFFKLVDGTECRTLSEDKVTMAPTPNPTTAAHAEYLASLLESEAEVPVDEDEGVGIGVFVGLGIGFLWCCLTAISVAYLLSARGAMEEQRDMEELLKAEKSDPLKNKEGDDDEDGKSAKSKKSSRSRKSGKSRRSGKSGKSGSSEGRRTSSFTLNDDDTVEEGIRDMDELEALEEELDHANNPNLKVEAKIELSKSVRDDDFDKNDGPPVGAFRHSYRPTSKAHQRGGRGGVARSVVVTSRETMDDDGGSSSRSHRDSHRRSTGDVARHRASHRRSTGHVAGGRDDDADFLENSDRGNDDPVAELERDLAASDEKALRSSQVRRESSGTGSGRRRHRRSGSGGGGNRRSRRGSDGADDEDPAGGSSGAARAGFRRAETWEGSETASGADEREGGRKRGRLNKSTII